MNIFKKIYCRVFQTAFRLALPVLPYRKPQIVGSVRELPDVIRGNHCSCVLIVTDSSIRSLGLTKRLEHTLERAAIPFFIYDGTVANPTTINVAEALELYRDHRFRRGIQHGLCQGCWCLYRPSEENTGADERHLESTQKTSVAHCHSNDCRNRK